MSKYTDEQRSAIMARSAATLQRDDAEHEQPPMSVGMPHEDLLAEALRQPLETRNQRDRRELQEQEELFARERRRRERGDRHAPADVDLRIGEAIADERLFMREVLGEVITELNERQHEAVESAVLTLRTELAELKVSVAEQRVKICELQLAGDQGKPIDLPALPSMRSRAN